jgi:hypothetical protein
MRVAALLAAVAPGVPMHARPVPPAVPPLVAAGVPVRLFLDQARYTPGSDGQVRVEIGQDGYLVVLYANPDGHVSIAWPVDPGLSDRVSADTEIAVLRPTDIGIIARSRAWRIPTRPSQSSPPS